MKLKCEIICHIYPHPLYLLLKTHQNILITKSHFKKFAQIEKNIFQVNGGMVVLMFVIDRCSEYYFLTKLSTKNYRRPLFNE